MSSEYLLPLTQTERAVDEHFQSCVYSALQLESLMQHRQALSAFAHETQGLSFEDHPTLSQSYTYMVLEPPSGQLSTEVIKEALEKLWQAIKNAIFRLIRATKDFLYKLIRGTEGMLKAIDKQRDKIDQIQKAGLAPPTRPIAISGGSRLHMGGEIDVRQLTNGIDNGVAILGQVKGVYLDGAIGLVNELEGLTDKLRKVDATNAGTLQDQIRALSTYPSRVSVEMDSVLKGLRDRELPGGKRVSVEMTEYTKRGVPKNMPDLSLDDYQSRVSYRERDKVLVPDLPDYSTLLDTLETLVRGMIEANERVDTLANRYERISKRADDLFDRQSVMGRLKEHMHEQTVELLMRYYQMAMPVAIHRLVKYEFAVARSTLAYINAGLDSYETPR